jgi:hypothetical protein
MPQNFTGNCSSFQCKGEMRVWTKVGKQLRCNTCWNTIGGLEEPLRWVTRFCGCCGIETWAVMGSDGRGNCTGCIHPIHG